MSNDVNVPDSAIRMHDAVVCLELCLLADRRLGQFPEPGSVIRMNLLKEVFAVGRAIGWIETHNTITLLRPVTGSPTRSAPRPTAGWAARAYPKIRKVCSDQNSPPDGASHPKVPV